MELSTFEIKWLSGRRDGHRWEIPVACVDINYPDINDPETWGIIVVNLN